MTTIDLRGPRRAAGQAVPRAVLALAALLAALWVMWDLPTAHLLVAVVTLAYAGLLMRWPHAWALALPALIPVYDLSLWTGRYVITEFDVLVLVTLARHYLRPGSRPVVPPLTGWAGVLGGLFVLSAILSGLMGARAIGGLAPDNINFYLEPMNMLRVAKGLLWAWLLWPLLRAARREGAQPLTLLMIGFAAAGLAFGLTAMWERGVFRLLAMGASPRELVSAVLGFSGRYRITGLLGGMHVGGTATDGFLALAVPLSVGGALLATAVRLRILCAVGAALALYAAMLTVSRGLLAGVVLALLLLAAWAWRQQVARHGAGMAIALLPLTSLAVCCVLSFGFGGNEAVAETLLLMALAAAVPRLGAQRLFKGAGLAVLALLVLAGGVALHGSFAESRWSALADALEWPAAGAMALAVVACGGWLGHLLRRVPVAVLAGGFVAFAGVAGIMLPAIAGSSMTSRLARSEADLGTRQRHWDAALETVARSPRSLAFGMGVGSYPSYYLTLDLGDEGLASGLVTRESGTSFMRQGMGDFSIGQRVPLEPDRAYVLSGRLRSGGNRSLSVKFCPRNVLLFDRYTPQCVADYLPAPTPGWQSFTFRFNSGDLGRFGPLDLPTTLVFYNGRNTGGGLVDYTGLTLRPAEAGPDTPNLIANGDFSHGIDRWFMVSDFNHLAWHVKNIFLHMLFEQGVFGLLTFVALVTLGLARGAVAAWAGDAAGAALAATLAGLMVVGLFGTMVDNPTVALAIYLVILAAADLPALRHAAPGTHPLDA